MNQGPAVDRALRPIESVPSSGGPAPHAAAVWLRASLFPSFGSAMATVLVAGLLGWALVMLADWAIVRAIWSVEGGQSQACRAPGAGACWAVVSEKRRFILFGTYPYDQHWRPLLTVAIFVGLFFISASRRFWRRGLLLVWIASLLAIGVIMWGGILGLAFVPQEQWGGLPVTLILATFGLVLGFPLGIFVALGRRSRLRAIRLISIAYVEFIRGVPLVSLLFMASVMVPLFLPDGMNVDKLGRALFAFTIFAGAYIAEVVRGGLQVLPKGQAEAADALGLGYWQKTALIIVPQALQLVIPALVNTFIGIFKDTSLVLIIGILDLLTAGKLATVEPAWQGFGLEVLLAVGLIYFAFCFTMSRYSQNLEGHLNRSQRH